MRLAAPILLCLAGCGGFGANTSPDLAGPHPDLGGAISDMGAASDGSMVTPDVTLTSPAAWISLVPIDTSFAFDVSLPATPSQLESYFSVKPRAGGTALAGGFSWKGSAGVFKLTFIPSAKLADGADYIVEVNGPLITKPKVGFSTGSHPRVRALSMTPVGPSDVELVVTFSEPMKETSLAGKVMMRAGLLPGANLPFTLTMMDLANYKLTIPNGQAAALPLTLQIDASVQAMTGTALDPKSWDSLTDVSGGFEYAFQGPGGEFVPEIQ